MAGLENTMCVKNLHRWEKQREQLHNESEGVLSRP